jgi:uncharacterized protein (DUF1501 family)
MIMDRREFLKNMSAAGVVTFLPRIALAAQNANYDRLLILIELKGGNDGLNTLIPFTDANYYRLRPKIGIPRDQILQLSETLGFHPSLKDLMPLWEARELSVIQGVGYPKPNLSHFRSIEIWDTASNSEEYLNEGWLARAFEKNPTPKNFAADGVVIGSYELGPLNGVEARIISLANTEQFLNQARLATATQSSSNKALEHILKVEADIIQAAANLKSNYIFKTEFPKHAFGNSVKTAAQVLASGAPVAAIRLTHGGFDTHSNQPNTQARLLKELSEGIVALRSALIELNRWQNSLGMTYAEFGRRAKENLSNGTDHGTASVHFAFGGKVKGGLYGSTTPLHQLENDNLIYAVDFRNLYATALNQWWGISTTNVLKGIFAPIDLVKT